MLHLTGPFGSGQTCWEELSPGANIEEVETEVVEIEAKLEKVTEGTAELLCIQTQTKPGFTRNQKIERPDQWKRNIKYLWGIFSVVIGAGAGVLDLLRLPWTTCGALLGTGAGRPCGSWCDVPQALLTSPTVTSPIFSVPQLVKLCSGMIEAGKAYIGANKLFVSGIRDLSQHCQKDEMISEFLEKCGESLQEIINYHTVRAERVVVTGDGQRCFDALM
ncbi:Arf-GAP with coiled-coil, ANK repeat and PH domain-containing protein 3 [Takifugu flavidus]|uniref:Arf-GAP with coiled-coil, ANK repeat and PH domain-containing protein 3 n=1 Tax=Takifugu flavidus TaxID=433684 RepID=A0A5C6MV03_9TELE|nr:Arf-GAP with coiled-coil, ANK repeat and PH domain-containing protein 3 [Takifugu flavidus]